MFLLSKNYWEVRKTPNKGRGIYAQREISAGTVIGDYIGKLTADKNISRTADSFYDMYFNETTSIVANKKTTGIHLINHSCSSNCHMFPYKNHTLFFACRRIFAGEELTIQYLIDPPEKNHICNHICYCESPICHGTMHTSARISKKFSKFIDARNQKPNDRHIEKLGETVSLLNSYPKIIADYSIYDLYGCFTESPLTMHNRRLPTIKDIREKIRQDGRILYFKYLNFYVFGITNGIILGTQNLSYLTNEK